MPDSMKRFDRERLTIEPLCLRQNDLDTSVIMPEEMQKRHHGWCSAVLNRVAHFVTVGCGYHFGYDHQQTQPGNTHGVGHDDA